MAGSRHSLGLPWIPVTFMFRDLLLALASTTVLLTGSAHADEPSGGASLVLLTENFPPYNMAKNGKNFAKEENIEGIAVDIVRETFKRAGISYNLTLRFPWERIYKLALEKPGYGVFVMAPMIPGAFASSSDLMSPRLWIPPEAITGILVAAASAAVNGTLQPCIMPSLAMSV